MDQIKLNYIDDGIPNFIVNDLDPLTDKISAVYNIGGGYKNSISLLESIEKIESLTNIKMNFCYENDYSFLNQNTDIISISDLKID